MLYQIRDYVTEHTLNMLYYSFVYSILNYGIIVWGTATQNQLHEINVRMNNIVRTITWNKKFSHFTHLQRWARATSKVASLPLPATRLQK